MSSILDAAVLFGEETTYGTAAALTRGYEAKADTWKRVTEPLESGGMRAGMQTVRSDRRKQITLGAEGELSDLDFLTNGMGLLLQSMLGSVAGPTVNVITLTTASDITPKSFTVQVLRPTDAGTLVPFTYLGAVMTSWTIAQAMDDLLKVGLTFDAQDEVTNVAAGTPTYPAGAVPFDWTQAAVQLGGSSVDNVRAIEFAGDLGLKTDRRHLRGSSLKKAPRRAAVPTYSGSLTSDFSDVTEYDRFVAGDIFPVQATWTGASFGGGNYSVDVLAQACQYDGDSPAASLTDLTVQTMPFRILHDGTNPAVAITITTDDVAL